MFDILTEFVFFFSNEFNSALFSAYVCILIGAMLMEFAVDTFGM